MTDTINIDGYTVTIETEYCPENPFEAWDCEPPLLACYDRPTAYNGAPETVADVLDLLPASAWDRANRAKLAEHLPTTLKEWAEERRTSHDARGAYTRLCEYHYGERLSDSDGMGWAAGTLNAHGIPALSTVSRGYSQGDATPLLVIATPEWVEMVGAPDPAAQLQSAADLYGAWAWGDVYGVSEITDPDGDPLADCSCGGFYGSDHEASGLLDFARESINIDKAEKARQAEEAERERLAREEDARLTALNEPACLI